MRGGPLGAFIEHDDVVVAGSGKGPLAGLSFAAKDLYDVEGHVTGYGNPTWLATHEAAARTAPAVQRLLDAGADLAGKTHTDELAYSLNGENVHYGTPLNSAAPGRIPGGSSSGSASAVAGGAVDFALGSDTGGSVRVPASYCGLYGFRPSHGRIPLDGACPLAPSFDAAGWFARDVMLLARVGEVMLGERLPAQPLPRLLIAADALAVCDPEARDAVRDVAGRFAAKFETVEEITVAPDGLAAWMAAFRILQAAEIWRCHGEWVSRHSPNFGPGVKERFAFAATVTAAQVAEMAPKREAAAARMASLLGPRDVLLIPSAPGAAPLKGSSGPALEDFRGRALRLTCIAGLARLPQASLPLARADGCPLGVSLVARRGADLALLRTALATASA